MKETVRERRAAKQSAAERALDEFLNDLDPILLLYVRGDWTEDVLREWLFASEERIRAFDAAREQYYRLASRVPPEWRRFLDRLSGVQEDVLERLYRRKGKGRGAPGVAVEEHGDVLIAHAVHQAEEDLTDAFLLASQRKKAGGYLSSQELIEEELLNLGYDNDQIQAVVEATTARGAAQRYVARTSGCEVGSVKAMASRGRKLLTTQNDHTPPG